MGKIVDLKVGKRALDNMSWITSLKPHLFMLLIYLRSHKKRRVVEAVEDAIRDC
jgi:hypothetical protein